MRVPKPWFRKQNKTWYVQLDGVQHNLGSDKRAAFDEYHKLIAKRGEGVQPGAFTVQQVLAAYWHWVQQNRAEATARRREVVLRSFGLSIGKTLKASALRPLHVQKWINANETYKVKVVGDKYVTRKFSPTTIGDYITVIKGVFNWAESMGFVDRSPIAKMPKPTANVRQEFIAVDAWPTVLKRLDCRHVKA